MLITIDKDQIMEMAEDWLNKTMKRDAVNKKLVSVETKYIDSSSQWVLILEDYAETADAIMDTESEKVIENR